MPGIRNSNINGAVLGALAILAGGMPQALVADEVFLEGTQRLSGNVRAISENGSVLLETPLSPEVIAVSGEGVRKAVFSAPTGQTAATNCVTLTNEDVLPGAIEAIDDNNLTLVSSAAGRVVIPRNLVYSLQLGIHQSRVIYAGPDGLNGWLREPTTAEHWTFDNGALQVRGSGRISRDLEVPPQFVVRFNLSWDINPNLRCYFAADPGNTELPPDRYYLQFNAAGIELKRESSSGRRYTTITTLNRLPQQYPGKRLTIEIRVDRPSRTLQLFLNDEPEGSFKDPVAKPPAAGGIGFESMVGEMSKVQISKLEVLDWNLKGERRRSEARGDATKDALIGIKGERFSGRFMATKKGPDGMLYGFKSAFQEEALEVPEAEISTVFLAGHPPPVAEATNPPFILHLRGGGALHVSSCAFSAEQVEATHPLLGRLTLRRDGVAAFERVSPKSKEAKEP
ncbi:MAG: hypothetical protein WCO57_05010 [Verrucomicrobiota bacterium]